MDLKEAYRVLEVDIGAPRADVDAAYLRLLEKWHPGRAAAQGPAAVGEAQRKVQAINEAYNLLAAIAPTTTQPPIPLPSTPAVNPRRSSAPPPAAPSDSVTRAPISKPKLAPLSTAQPDLKSPPPPKPPPGAWDARTAPAPGGPAPAGPAAAPATAPAPPPAVTPEPAAPIKAAPTPPPPTAAVAAAPRPAPAPPPAPAAPPPATLPPEPAAAKARPSRRREPESSPGFLAQAAKAYNLLFPEGTPRRRFGPYVVAGAALFFLLLVKCTFSSSGPKRPREPDPKTTARLMVKSNLAGVSIEAKRMVTADDASFATFTGAVDQPLAGLPPGKYAVTASAAGWPPLHAEATLEAGHQAELAMNFKGGSLKLDSDPTGAAVRMGDQDLGRTPLTIPMLPPGETALSIEYPSWPAVSFKATIAEGETATATVRLPHGKLTVESTPSGATVLLGRQTLGVTPLALPGFPAGTRKLTLQARDFPALVLPVTIDDGADITVHPNLGTAFPVLDPNALLRNVWVPDNPDAIAPPFDGLSGPSAPRNGVIKNLNRKLLYNYWLTKFYRYTGTVKGYEKNNGEVELVEQQNDYCRFHVVARLSAAAHADPEVVAALTKGATFSFYGRLSAVEESRWSKAIVFEFSNVEPLK